MTMVLRKDGLGFEEKSDDGPVVESLIRGRGEKCV
jgi:hypothetical protein